MSGDGGRAAIKAQGEGWIACACRCQCGKVGRGGQSKLMPLVVVHDRDVYRRGIAKQQWLVKQAPDDKGGQRSPDREWTG